jgi:hypothetical protein
MEARKVERLLREGDFAFRGIRPIEPSLEDVFVSVLTEEKARVAHG